MPTSKPASSRRSCAGFAIPNPCTNVRSAAWFAAMRARLATLMRLALPMVIARATQSAITFADAIQGKHLGTDAVAAGATGGLNAQLFVFLPMGIAFIVQSFVAQLVGRGEREETRRFAWYGIAIAVTAALVAGGA